uniref:Helicase ATP-binding domain-containing protein n=1 Tax=Physcomitrium patens TaxID=3218 RepID=A0A7I4DX35_PHYPA
MATALANPGVLGSEFLSSRSGESLSSKHKSSLVNLNSRTSGFTITSRSAAFLCVAFAGNPGSQGGAQGSNHSAREIKKKTPYSKRRQRSLKSKKNVAAAHTGAGVASDISKNDLRALISNSLVPVFFDEVETSGEPEISQVSSENDQNAVLQSDNAGFSNPLGRKVLGKAVINWLKEGVTAMVREVACAQERGEIKLAEERMGTGHNLVALAQPYLIARPMPEGLEPLCLRASLHYPTIFDHYQRELRAALQASQERGKLDNWQNTESWKLLKKFAKSGEHRAVARKVKDPNQIHNILGLSQERVAEIQSNVDSFVTRGLELLQIERDAELEATHQSLEGAASAIGSAPTSSGIAPRDKRDEQALESCDSITNLIATGSTTGLGGMHLVTLSVEGKGHLPPTTISPGDMVCVRISDRRRGGSTMECMRGSVYSLAEDNNSIAIAIEARYGDPTFSRLFGKSLRLDRISALADATTYQRDCEALERLQKNGLKRQNPAAAVVATLFGEGPDICWLAQNGPLRPASPVQQSSLKEVRLDESQKRAIEMGLDRKRPVVVIQGPPGTGKTSVVTELIEKAVMRGERVLATAPTNAAVDNIVERLANAGLNVVRVGNPARVAPAVCSRSLSFIVDKSLTTFRGDLVRRRANLRSDLRECLDNDSVAAGIRQVLKQLGKSLKQKEKEAINDALSSAQVILCTNTGAGDPLIRKQEAFDLVVVDEAAQAIEPSCWIPLLQGRRCVLAGDASQLAPTIMSRTALDGGLGVSLMERAGNLHSGLLSTMLSTQYRMHSAIADWASHEMYGGSLRSAPAVASHLLRDTPGVKDTPVTKVPMLLLDTRLPFGSLIPGCEERLDPAGTGSFYNEGEADIVVDHIRALLATGVEPSSIAVQSPYMAQVQLLCDRIEEIPGAEGVQVASVDSFQGREADAVVVSMVMLLNHYACTLCICQPSNFFTDDNKQWTKLMRPTFYCTFPTSFKGKLLYQVSHSAKLMSNF